MELLKQPNSDYVLQVSLRDLHTQAVDWMKEIEFMKDEVSFFYKVIQHHEMKSSFPSREKAQIEKDLVAINADDLDRVKLQLGNHQQMLSLLYQSRHHQKEEDARRIHAMLQNEINSVASKIRDLKGRIFSFAKTTTMQNQTA